MAQVKEGDTVKVNYTGKLEDGTVFDTSEGREPLEFTEGDHHVIPGFEQAVLGMSPGETKTVKIPANEAYGPHQEELVAVVERNNLPPDLEVEVGDQLQLRDDAGRAMVVEVTQANNESVTLDGNHPLAGKDLTFDIQLVEIEGDGAKH